MSLSPCQSGTSNQVIWSNCLAKSCDMHKDVHHLFQVNKCLRIPVGLHKVLHDMSCYQSIQMTPLIIFARCCKLFIGYMYSVRVDTWYSEEEGM